ncbi:hypothetical protein NOK64_04145 [Vibrio parahaemolyticus]|uniref:hypothetical protein n=1 Tax=Vibrio parahaemolyticus TaxID=670 RepID=UPI00226AC192|nr:hypothetical protein [Vibrio parahaemolyticus]MCX8755028.1 hypothetical protein [Vibrio parahaemolyticus]
MKLSFERNEFFFKNLSKDEQLEILFEDRKNMSKYIAALKMYIIENQNIEKEKLEEELLIYYLKKE